MLASERPYKISIGEIYLRLTKLKANNQQAKKIRVKGIMKDG